jgi:hypothetical protein
LNGWADCVLIPQVFKTMSGLMLKLWERALEYASRITHPYTIAGYTAVVAAILFSVAAWKNRWRLASALATGVVVLGLAPTIASMVVQHERTYHVRIVVLSVDNEPANEARVTSLYGEAPMQGPGRWGVEIASQLKPSNGKVTFFAAAKDSYLAGNSTIELKDDWFPEITIQLHPLPSVAVRGVVVDASGRSVPGARVSVIGYSDLATTDGMGNFSLSAHAADGQMVTVRAEKSSRSAQLLTPAGSGIVLVLR